MVGVVTNVVTWRVMGEGETANLWLTRSSIRPNEIAVCKVI